MIEQLPTSFEGKGEVSGTTFHLVDRVKGKGYVYRCVPEDSRAYYEVFEHREVNKYDYETQDVLEDKKVRYPRSRDFGSWAWTTPSAVRAKEILENIKNK